MEKSRQIQNFSVLWGKHIAGKMPTQQGFHDSILYIIRSKSAVNRNTRSKRRGTIRIIKTTFQQNTTLQANKKLKALKELFEAGIISRSEYETKRWGLVEKL